MSIETQLADLISSAVGLTQAANLKKTELDTAVENLASTADSAGSSLVGYDGGTVQSVLDTAKALADYTALRAYTGRATGVRITKVGIAGFFQRDAVDTTSTDNGGTIIVDGSGRRWKRLFDSDVLLDWFELAAYPTDCTTQLQTIVNFCQSVKKPLVFTGGNTYGFTGITAGDFLHLKTRGGVVFLKSLRTNVPDSHTDYFIKGEPTYYGPSSLLSADALPGQRYINVVNPSEFTVGMSLAFYITRLCPTDHRGEYREGQINCVSLIDAVNNRVYLEDPVDFDTPANRTYTGAIATVTSQYELVLSGVDVPTDQLRCRMTMTSGPANGLSMYITHWDNDSKIAEFDQKWGSGWSVLPQVGDSFKIEWMTNVFKHAAGHFVIDGDFHMSRERVLTATPGDDGYNGIVATGYVRPRIRGLTIENFSYQNITFTSCHWPEVENCVINGANLAYGVFGGTGYGVSINQCSHPRISKIKGGGNRRLVDLNGTQCSTTHALIEGSTAFGGGVAYDGVEFYPVGATENGGFGSHGNSFWAKYVNCRTVDLTAPYNIRGLDESIINHTHVGSGDTAVLLHEAGSGLFIDGFECKTREYEVNEPNPYDDTNALTHFLQNFLFVELEPKRLRKGRPIIVSNVSVKPVRQSFCYIETNDNPGLIIPPIRLSNIDVWVNSTDPAEVFYFYRGDADKIPSSIEHSGIRVWVDDEMIANAHAIITDTTFSSTANYVIRLSDNTWYVSILDDGVVEIPTESNVATVDIVPTSRDVGAMAIGMVLYNNRNLDYSPLAASNKTNVNLTTSTPTGTTGVDGKLTVAFYPSSNPGGYGALFVENRLGARNGFLVKMTTLN